MRFHLPKLQEEKGIAPILVVIFIASSLVTLAVVKSIAIPATSITTKSTSAQNVGIGTTSPDSTLTVTPTDNTGIGSSAPSGPTPTSTPIPTPTPTSSVSPTPTPVGSATMVGDDGTTCFDSDVGLAEEIYVKGYCQDNTGIRYDTCNTTTLPGAVDEARCHKNFLIGTTTVFCKTITAGGYGGGSSGEVCEDGAFPIFNITNPVNSTTVSGTIDFIADVYYGGVNKVEFYVDGVLKTTKTLDSPARYTYRWDTTTASNAVHTLSATAYDFVVPGKYWTKSVSVTTNNQLLSATPTSTPTPTLTPVPLDTTPPTVSIIYPLANSNVSGIVTIEAAASDNVGIAKVEIYGEGPTGAILLATRTTSPYTAQWDTTAIQNGNRSIYAYAYDARYNSATVWNIVNVNNAPLADTTVPTATITNPLNGATVTGTVNITADATDNVGVTKVEFFVDGTLKTTDTAAPYGFGWDSSTVGNGNHSLAVKVYDGAGNIGSESIGIAVANADITPPSTPVGLLATAVSYNQVNLNWIASTDNVGVSGYWIVRSGVTIGSSATNSFIDTTVTTSTSYTYQVIAFDSAGNSSAVSVSAVVTTPPAPDTQAPTAPTNLVSITVSSSQINLSWTASLDNVGVAGYDVYRNNVKITTVTTTSFGDVGLSQTTTYTYAVRALDSAGNLSPSSNFASATTQPIFTTGNISGTVSSSIGGVIAGAKVTTTVNGAKRTFYTNSQGGYIFTELKPAVYTLTFSAKGYVNLKTSVSVTAGATSINNVILKRR